MNEIACPTCGMKHTEEEWNNNTQIVVSDLNNSLEPIIPIQERAEGVMFRCPNPECEDEVITDKGGNLVVQYSD